MAGAGFRTFAAGEVLTASNVNTYLMEQSIMNFAGTAARSSAISSPSEGMFAYLQDTNTLTFYNGSAWVNAGSAIAGTALSSGTASSGQVLTANGSGGVSFGNGGLVLLNTTSFSAVSSVALAQNTFTSTYDAFQVHFYISAVTADAAINMRVRAAGTDASGANYFGGYPGWTAAGASFNTALNVATSGFVFDVDGGSSGNYYLAKIDVFDIATATPTKFLVHNHFVTQAGAAAGQAGSVDHAVSTAYDSINFIASAGNITGKIVVYAYNK